jgi:hypothetical protein
VGARAEAFIVRAARDGGLTRLASGITLGSEDESLIVREWGGDVRRREPFRSGIKCSTRHTRRNLGSEWLMLALQEVVGQGEKKEQMGLTSDV